ncbi:ABC transporter ATP-binding protein [Sinorhizobium garamanticum]|uniref:ABC transporter ATP-binding protein n=1 Tax=Sinorhizobium garamanticum TaxID=680247 RepID=A0ABY8D9J6_9HYPH|nr:ABC transporter ATP-binding protein [Sinorhizobium garamanticum]WEX85736.1 ABC transporter ATP-binding protein [Sinorhizobium garamanticum]
MTRDEALGRSIAANNRLVRKDAAIGLRAEHVSITTPDGRRIVDAVDLSVEPGERLAIVGPNGAGKTSLLRLFFGRLKPDAGRILLGDRDLARISLTERARMFAVVGQNDLPDLRMTLADYVDLGRIPHRGRVSAAADREIVERALDLLGLGAAAGRRLQMLSGGERQRAAIARALAQEPSILILDEPTNHLDPRARADMLETARHLRITVVAVLHDLTSVSPFADRVAVMQGGRLVAHDAPAAALDPKIVRNVFAMDCFPFTNPETGRSLLVFDTPALGGSNVARALVP